MRTINWFWTTILCLCITLSSLVTPATALPTNKATWLYFNFPPLFMTEEDRTLGFGVDIMNILTKEMIEYNHTMIKATPGRMIEDLKAEKQVVIMGMLKTPAREEIMHFSKYPCRLGSTSMVAMRTEDIKKYAPNGTVSIKALFEDKTLKFGHIPNMTYGKLQDLLLANKDKTRTISSPGGMEQLIEMIIRARVDWTIVDPLSISYFNTKQGVGDTISIVPIEEQPLEFMPGYFNAPKTTWGIKAIERIDEIMLKQIRSGELFKILAPYAPSGHEGEFKQAYDTLILKPALQ